MAFLRASTFAQAEPFDSVFRVSRPLVQNGDVLLLIYVTDRPVSTMGVSGGGWSTVAAQNFEGFFDTHGIRVWRRVVSGSLPNNFTLTKDGDGSDGLAFAVAIADADLTVDARIAVLTPAYTGEGVETPNVQPAAPSHFEIRVAVLNPAEGEPVSMSAPPGYSLLRSETANGWVNVAIAYKSIVSSSPSGVKMFPATTDDFFPSSLGITISIPSVPLTPPAPPDFPDFSPARGDGLYQYDFNELLTGKYVGTLDLQQVRFDVRIGQSGQFSASLPITSREIGDQVAAIVPRTRSVLDTGPGVLTCRVVRGTDLWQEYWIYAARIFSQSPRQVPVLELRGLTLDALLMHVLLREDLPSFTSTDQIEIARQLITHMQEQEHANIGLILQSGSSGVTRDWEFKADQQATYGQLLRQLAEVLNGFEWYVDVSISDGTIQRLWKWGCPTLGDPDAEHSFELTPHGGNILGWDIEIDALRGGTMWQARGDVPEQDASVSGVPLISQVHAATAHLAAGWPRIDRVIDRPGVKSQQTLDDYAAAFAAKRSGAARVFSVTVALGANPTFTPHTLGDHATFAMINEFFPRPVDGKGAGYDERHRVIGMEITPVSRDSKEEARLILQEEVAE